jgi:hypothetical protein
MENNGQVPNFSIGDGSENLLFSNTPITFDITKGKLEVSKIGNTKSRELIINIPTTTYEILPAPTKIYPVFKSSSVVGQFKAEDNNWYNTFPGLSSEPNKTELNIITPNNNVVWFNYVNIPSNIKEIQFALFKEEIVDGKSKWVYIPTSLSIKSFTWNDIK